MLRIGSNSVNKSKSNIAQNPFASVSFKAQSPNLKSSKLQKSPFADHFAKAGTEKIKAEIQPIRTFINQLTEKASTLISQTTAKYPKIGKAGNKAKAAVKKVASVIMPKTVKAKLLSQKSVAQLADMFRKAV